jgi:hypothetical protein
MIVLHKQIVDFFLIPHNSVKSKNFTTTNPTTRNKKLCSTKPVTLHNIYPSKSVGMSTITRFKLIFFVPASSLEVCKAAIFAAGAGRYPGPGNYTECCWTAFGTGQFRPGDAAKPNIGKVGELEEVQEARVETLCLGEDVARKAVAALKR